MVPSLRSFEGPYTDLGSLGDSSDKPMLALLSLWRFGEFLLSHSKRFLACCLH